MLNGKIDELLLSLVSVNTRNKMNPMAHTIVMRIYVQAAGLLVRIPRPADTPSGTTPRRLAGPDHLNWPDVK